LPETEPERSTKTKAGRPSKEAAAHRA
jgi:hypothetical protein